MVALLFVALLLCLWAYRAERMLTMSYKKTNAHLSIVCARSFISAVGGMVLGRELVDVSCVCCSHQMLKL